jgi:methionine biosynthesis protein MetW
MNMEQAEKKRYADPGVPLPYGSIARVMQAIRPGEEVLDVGCSEGYLARLLKGNKVWGVDYNEEAVRVARNWCVDARAVDLNNDYGADPFGRKFDVIVFADVLEHLLHPAEVLATMARLLKPGGRVVISLPNVALWRVRLNLFFGRFDYQDYGVLDRTHLHFYTFRTARRFVEECGYRVESTKGAANLLGPIVHFVPILRGLFAINIIIVAKPAN